MITIRKLDTPQAKKVDDLIRNHTNGYCPCQLKKCDDTKCMCKMFRDAIETIKLNETIICHCGLYQLTKTED